MFSFALNSIGFNLSGIMAAYSKHIESNIGNNELDHQLLNDISNRLIELEESKETQDLIDRITAIENDHTDRNQ